MYRVSRPRRCAQRLVRVALWLLVIGWTIFQGLPVSVKFAQGQAGGGSAERAVDDTGITSLVINPLNIAREGHTATLLQNGKVLVAGGRNTSGTLQSAQLYDPATGRWEPADDLNTPRHGHTAVLLQNGRVLVAGGQNGSAFLNTTELYDPDKNQWSVVSSPMRAARSRHTASLLRNGRVLVAGGENNSGSLQSAEEFDPSTGIWSSTGNLTTARREHTATLLANGKVLVAGGLSNTAHLRSAELYDPAKRTWSATGEMSAVRRLHTATLLTDGRVLVAGGQDSSGILNGSELYNPIKQTWTATLGSLNPPRRSHTATLLPNGRALVTGGVGIGGALGSVQLYDPAAQTWGNSANLNLSAARSAHTATLLASGKVLIVAGSLDDNLTFLDSVELLDPSTGAGTWTVTKNLATGQQSNLQTPREGHSATLLPDGQVLVAGGAGANGAPLASAELYDPATGIWRPTAGNLNIARHSHTATLLTNGQVLVVGGRGAGGLLDSAELYDPATESWSLTISEMSLARVGHTATLLPDGRVLVAGGAGTERSAELYNPATGIWSPTNNLMGSARQFHTATLLANGKVLVAGGNATSSGTITLDSAELFDPAQGTWTSTGRMSRTRWLHTATLLPNGKVLVAAGLGGTSPNLSILLDRSQLYDPATGTWSAGLLSTAVRVHHTATLLPNGKVLLAGGHTFSASTGNIVPVATVELYDPSVTADGLGLQTLSFTGPLKTPRYDHTATLLRDGQVLVAGGTVSDSLPPLNSSELYDLGLGYSEISRPVLTSAMWLGTNNPPGTNNPLKAKGIRFQGLSEASGGDAQSSASNYPLLQLRSLENEQTLFLLPDPAQGWSNDSFTSAPVTGFPAGPALLTVFINGIPSVAQIILPGASPRTASISGQVTDINGAGMANVTMTLTSSRGEVRTVLTGPNGEYSFTDLVLSGSQTVTIGNLSPSSITAGSQGFVLTVNGSGFVNGSSVRWNEKGRSTTFVSSMRLTAQIPASDIASPGPASVTVVNPDGSASSALTFTINPPAAAVLNTLVPPSTTAGGPQFTLTVNGTGFVNGSVIQWNGQNRTPTTFLSSTQLRVTIPASDITTAGTANVRVINPSAPPSNTLLFTINAAPPALTSMSPHSSGAGPFTLTVNGSGFVNSSVIRWNGQNRVPTTFVNSTQLRVTIPASDLSTEQETASVTVINPDGRTSNALCFTVTPIVISIGELVPINPSQRLAATGGSDFTRTLNWTGFSHRAAWGPTLTGLSHHLAAAGGSDFMLTLSRTGFSARLVPGPILNSMSPHSRIAGSSAFTLTIDGSGFVGGAVVRWDGQNRVPTTFVNSTRLTVTIPASDIATARTASVTVVNPGTSPSNSLCFTVTPAPGSSFVTQLLTDPSPTADPGPDDAQVEGAVSYTVTPSATTPDGQQVGFSPPSRSYDSLPGNVTNANFTAVSPTYPIAGTVTGLNSTVVNMTLTLLSSSSTRTAPTNSSGSYTFSNCVYLGNYQVSAPTMPEYNFNPTARPPIMGLDGPIIGENFAATPACVGPAITVQPSPQTVCTGATVSLSVSATGTGLTYQWRKGATNLTNTGNISGVNTPTLTINAASTSDAGSYNVVITSACGTVTSNAASLTLNAAPAITSQPASLTRCVGQSATFSVAATGTGLTYQWRKNGSNLAGETGSSLTIASVGAGDAGSYDVVVTGTCGSATSNATTLTVNPATSITTQPASQTICTGQAVTFSVTASGSGLAYQWRKNGAAISGATNSSYSIAATAAGDAGAYDVIVTGACGNATSNAATLTVNSATNITAQPASQTVCVGAPASFSVAASGTGPFSYQWRKNGTAIGGATNGSYNIAAVVAGDAGSYDVVVTGACGSVTSSAASLTINTPLSVTANPTDQTVCAGAGVTFTAAASGSPAPTVQWQVSTDGGASFANLSGMMSPTLTFTASAAQNGYRYRAVFTGACGPATTAVATLTVSACTPTLALSYNGLLRDRVGQGETALSGDSAMDGTFTVALQAGSGNRTVTSLQLTRSGNSGIWDTIPSNVFWVLGAANGLDTPLLNGATGAVSFTVADGGSFTVFASDFNNSLFGPGASFTLMVNFADGSTATAPATVPAAPPPPALTLSYNGLLRDRVGQSETALSGDGAMDGAFTVALQAGSGNRTITSLQLTRSGGSGIWDTIPSNGFWVLGAASGLDAPLLNSANGAVSFAVADGGSFTVFASDFNNSLFGPGSSFTLTVNFADGSTATAPATVPGGALTRSLMPGFAIFNYAPGGGFFNPLGFYIVRSVMSFGIRAKEA